MKGLEARTSELIMHVWGHLRYHYSRSPEYSNLLGALAIHTRTPHIDPQLLMFNISKLKHPIHTSPPDLPPHVLRFLISFELSLLLKDIVDRHPSGTPFSPERCHRLGCSARSALQGNSFQKFTRPTTRISTVTPIPIAIRTCLSVKTNMFRKRRKY